MKGFLSIVFLTRELLEMIRLDIFLKTICFQMGTTMSL